MAGFVTSFVIFPLVQYKRYSSDVGSGKYIYNLSKKLQGIRGNIGSNSNWHASLYLCYYLKSRYYGIPKSKISNQELQNELEEKKIDYYFFWGSLIDEPVFLSKYKEVTEGRIANLRIYYLK